MKHGYLEFEHQQLYFNAYQALYLAALRYAVNGLGSRLILSEMRTMDEKLDPKLINLVDLDDLLGREGG